jgi:Rrf2 family protein
MKRSSKLSVALHALVHLAQHNNAPLTSDVLAECLQTNPVVVRRTMGLLRENGLVTAFKGHGGGWQLAHTADAITIQQVSAALGEHLLIAINNDPGDEQCLIVRAVTEVMDDVVHQIELLLAERLSRMTLADLAADVRRRVAERQHHKQGGAEHESV